MCPACYATVAFVVASAATSGGVTAIVVSKLCRRAQTAKEEDKSGNKRRANADPNPRNRAP